MLLLARCAVPDSRKHHLGLLAQPLLPPRGLAHRLMHHVLSEQLPVREMAAGKGRKERDVPAAPRGVAQKAVANGLHHKVPYSPALRQGLRADLPREPGAELLCL